MHTTFYSVYIRRDKGVHLPSSLTVFWVRKVTHALTLYTPSSLLSLYVQMLSQYKWLVNTRKKVVIAALSPGQAVTYNLCTPDIQVSNHP